MAASAQTWNCITCTFRNQQLHQTCAVCNAQKPQQKLWQCIVCTFNNPISNGTCQICNVASRAHSNYKPIQASKPIMPHMHSNTNTNPWPNTNTMPSNNTNTNPWSNTNKYGWFYQTDNGLYQPYSDSLNNELDKVDIGQSFDFANNQNQYKFVKMSATFGSQTNLQTQTKRKVINELKCNISNGYIIKKREQQIAVDYNGPFTPHMTYTQAIKLRVGDKVDLRRHSSGYVCAGTVWSISTNQKRERIIKVRYDGQELKHAKSINISAEYFNQLWRLSIHKSIAKRPKHRFTHCKVGDFIDINPLYCDQGWKQGQIVEMDSNSGQGQIKFLHSTKHTYQRYWVHLDNVRECSEHQKGWIDFKMTEHLFFSTVSRSNFVIVDIQKITNPYKTSIYESILRTKCASTNRPKNRMERYLFHGTTMESLQLILKNGFDRSYNKTGRYGKGTYFAKNAAYSVRNGFCGKDKENNLFILLCRVIVGEYTVGNENMNAIPKKNDGTEYDSTVNSLSHPTIFSVWRDFMAVPYYLIKFQYYK